ncbi:spermidine synthase [Sphingomonas morindae]|uniref:Spermidine synthase n=1 Tax=Sphingomonas morindae TaxID=1541170 RepID=A0ABY4XDD2_9SPHN|nr:spermidine synthase [Sphingomonas morindae]USI74932.1 spermidine synthase [Sphingomonas morindae]
MMRRLRTANRRHRRAVRFNAGMVAANDGLAWLRAAPDLAAVPPPAAPSPRPPVRIVGTAEIPGGGVLHLAECGGDFSIQFDADELMGSHDHVSEEAFATLARAALPDGAGPVLIGGLGMGFTLRAARGAWPAPAEIIVAELVPGVVEWARGPLAHLFGDSLDDPRVRIAMGDVHALLDASEGAYQAILLDVDNGPDGFMRPENDRIYCDWGLRSAHRALRPGGVLGIWSAYPDPDFRARFGACGFAVEEHVVPAFAGSTEDHHLLWFGRRD